MRDIQKEILKNLDISRCTNELDYFNLLKLTFDSDELIYGILQTSYSSFYTFNQHAKRGLIIPGKLYRRLLKLYTFSKTGVGLDD